MPNPNSITGLDHKLYTTPRPESLLYICPAKRALSPQIRTIYTIFYEVLMAVNMYAVVQKIRMLINRQRAQK